MLKDNLERNVNTIVYNKSEAYKELVELMKSTYSPFDYSFDQADKNRDPEFWSSDMRIGNEMPCVCDREINLWTYWQGLGYAEKTPKIKYLLVGQD